MGAEGVRSAAGELEGLEDGTGVVFEFTGASLGEEGNEGFDKEDTDSEIIGAGGMGGAEGEIDVIWEHKRPESDASERTGVLVFLCFDRGDG